MGFASVAAKNKTLLWDSTNSVAVGTATNTNRWEGAQSSSSLNSHVCVYVSSWSPPPQVHRDREGPASVSQSEMLLPGAVPSRVLSCDRWWRQPGSPSQTGRCSGSIQVLLPRALQCWGCCWDGSESEAPDLAVHHFRLCQDQAEQTSLQYGRLFASLGC